MIRALRIAQVAPPLERVPPEAYGGTERIVFELVAELTRRGHDVTTFASGDSLVPGTLVPTVRRVQGMAALWGGDAELLALGAALQRYCRATGVGMEDAVRMVRTGRRTGPERKRMARARDRRQLTLPMQR